MRKLTLCLVIVLTAGCFIYGTCAIAAPLEGPGDEEDFRRFESRHYKVRTTLSRREAQYYARHMDIVFEAFRKRFAAAGYRGTIHRKMPLYLLRTKAEYRRLLSWVDAVGVEHTDGMFFKQSGYEGLATYTHRTRHSLSRTMGTLQHEGFHQFAQAFYGYRLPAWVDEGVAQYFEDGVIVNGDMYMRIVDGNRLRTVKKALREKTLLSFAKILKLDSENWQSQVLRQGENARVAYAQVWSMVYFLLHGRQGKYRAAFESYLKLVGNGQDGEAAFEQAFGVDSPVAFRDEWERFVRQQESSPLFQARERLLFLGRGMRILQDSPHAKVPRRLGELRSLLEKIKFRTVFVDSMKRVHRRIKYRAEDDLMYRYRGPEGRVRNFRMLPPRRKRLLPRITADALKPRPTLSWYINGAGDLVYDIAWHVD